MTSAPRDWEGKYPCLNARARQEIKKLGVVMPNEHGCGCENCNQRDFIRTLIAKEREEAERRGREEQDLRTFGERIGMVERAARAEERARIREKVSGIGHEPLALDEEGLPRTEDETKCYQRGYLDAKSDALTVVDEV